MQRCTFRVENFGGRFAAAIFDLLAMCVRQVRADRCPVPLRRGTAIHSPSFFSGMPIARRSCRASSSLRADVTIVMCMPCGRV